MGFAQELSDFFAGYKGMREIGFKEQELKDKDEDRAIRKKYYEDLAVDRAERRKAPDMRDGALEALEAGKAGATAHPVDAKVPTFASDQNEFIAKLMPSAIEASKETGVDPRIIVAQAAHESAWGRSAPGNNLFGIKAHGEKGGPALATTEVVGGKPVRTAASFRTFGSPEESVKGYARFINENPRYTGMRTARDPEAQLKALGASGYATDPDYEAKIRRIYRGIKMPGLPTAGVDPEEQPVVFAASGGLIEDTYSGDDESGGSNPAVRDAIESGDDIDPKSLLQGGTDMADIVNDGVQGIQSRIAPAGQGVDPQRGPRLEAFASNAGAPSPKDVKMIGDRVDPKGKLTEGQRNIAGWKAVYDFHTQKGNAPAAQRAAMAMLMYTKAAATQGGAIAEAAFEKGDYEGGAKAIVNAYNTLPDGTRIEIAGKTKDGVKFKMYDEESGEMTEEGEAKIDQLVQMATGMRNGTEWFRAVGAIANKKVDKVAARNEKDREALERFNEATGKGFIAEYRSGLEDDNAREEFDKLPTRLQTKIASEEARNDRARAAREGVQSRFDRRQEKAGQKGTGTGGRTSVGERADTAVDIERAGARADVYRTGDPNDELGVDTGTRSRLQAVDVGTSFNKMANDPNRKIDRKEVDALPDTLQEEWKAAATDADGNVRKDFKPLAREQTMLLSDIASDVMRGDFNGRRAAQVAIEATTPGAKITANRDGTVSINDAPPVRLSERSFLQLARLHGRTGNVNKKGLGPDAAIPEASPTGNKSSGGPIMGGFFEPGTGPALRERAGVSVRQGMRDLAAGVRTTDDERPVARRRDWTDPDTQPRAPRDWTDVPSRREWTDPPAHQAATTSQYDKNPARRRKEMREARRRGVPV